MVLSWTLKNNNGMRARIVSTGASLASLSFADLAELVLHPPNDGGYALNPAYLGCIVGRFANRIANGRFVIDGVEYQITPNQGHHALHGGSDGWHHREWSGDWVAGEEGRAIRLSLHSPAGDGGFPGAVDVSITYTLDDDNQLILDFAAQSDAATPFNITHHGYWNLSGRQAASILDHELTVFGDHYLPVDNEMIPTGELVSVAGGSFDWRQARRLCDVLDPPSPIFGTAGGLDHCFVGSAGNTVRLMATLYDPSSGRTIEVSSDQPGLQVYTGQWLGDSDCGHGNFAGVALETQHFPDSPNQAHFPNTILRPESPFRSRTIYAFTQR